MELANLPEYRCVALPVEGDDGAAKARMVRLLDGLDAVEAGSVDGVAELLCILTRALHPDERLQIDHVPRMEVLNISSNLIAETKQIGVGTPVRLGFVVQWEAILMCRSARDIGLQKDMTIRLRDESEYSYDRPCEYTRLLPR